MDTLEGVELTPLRKIQTHGGNVYHAIQNHEATFESFGEAYFSTVDSGQVKGWKKHTKMVLNIIVPVGEIKFVLYDGRDSSQTKGELQEVSLSLSNYQRLTVPPGIWMSFQGVSNSENMLLNVASIPHDPTEAENLALANDLIPYVWE